MNMNTKYIKICVFKLFTGVIQVKNHFNAKYANLEQLVSNECRLIKNVNMKIGLKTRFVRYVGKDSFCDTSSKSIWTLMQMWKLIHANCVEKCWKTLTHIEDTWLDHMVLVLRAKFVGEMILEQNKVCLNTSGISMVCTFKWKCAVSKCIKEVLILI